MAATEAGQEPTIEMTAEKFGGEAHRGVRLVEIESGLTYYYASYGHIDPALFAEAANERLARDIGDDFDFMDPLRPEEVTHVWAIAHPLEHQPLTDEPVQDWSYNFGDPDRPNAFPMTYVPYDD